MTRCVKYKEYSLTYGLYQWTNYGEQRKNRFEHLLVRIESLSGLGGADTSAFRETGLIQMPKNLNKKLGDTEDFWGKWAWTRRGHAVYEFCATVDARASTGTIWGVKDRKYYKIGSERRVGEDHIESYRLITVIASRREGNLASSYSNQSYVMTIGYTGG